MVILLIVLTVAGVGMQILSVPSSPSVEDAIGRIVIGLLFAIFAVAWGFILRSSFKTEEKLSRVANK